MYVKFRNFHLNELKIPNFSSKARHQKYEKFLYVGKIPLEFNSSYTLKPSCETPAWLLYDGTELSSSSSSSSSW